MKKIMKASAAVLAAVFALTVPFGTPVKAEEINEEETEESRDYVYVPQSCGVVLSEDVVEGHSLQWEARWFFDTLVGVSDEGLNITYEYNADGLRTSKTENGETTNYEYNNDYYLVSQNCNGKSIEFVYNEDIYGPKPYKGFYYENGYYEYSYDENGVIDGLNKDGVRIAQYTYDGCAPGGVYEINEDGTYTDKTGDSSFIGNINPIRYTQRYYEEKLNWYYGNGRYYSPQEGRYIDGISEERAEELKGIYSDFELMVKTYTFGRIWANTNGRLSVGEGSGQISETELVTLVIYLESSASAADQDCVAWVIKNRIDSTNDDFKYVNTAAAVVQQPDQFSTMKQIEGMTSYPYDPTNNFWVHAAELADKLVRYNPNGTDAEKVFSVQKPRWFTTQVNFYSVETFVKTQIVGTELIRYLDDGGRVIHNNCGLVPVGGFTYYELQYGIIDLNQYVSPKIYNVFCTATYRR